MCVAAGWVSWERNLDICDFYGEGDSEEYENQWIYVLRVAEEINETLKREKQRKFKVSFFIAFRSTFFVSKNTFWRFLRTQE